MKQSEQSVSHEWQRILDLDSTETVHHEHSPRPVEPPRFEVLP